MVNQIIPTIIILAILILLNAIPKVGLHISNVFLLLFFMFMTANSDLQGATFYFGMTLANIVFGLFEYQVQDIQRLKFADLKIKGAAISIFSFGVGIILFIIMLMIQSRQANAIIGVPQLYGISTVGVKALMTSSLGVAFLASLGFCENRFFFGIFNLIRLFIMPILAGIFGILAVDIILLLTPLAIISFFFAIFHVAAFSLAIGSLIWAFIIFMLWSVSYLYFGEEPSSLAHFFWNAAIGLKRGLSIAGGFT